MEEKQEMAELLHLLINKTVVIQGLIRQLQKTQLDDKQKPIVEKSKVASDEIIKAVKQIREISRR